MSKTFAVSCALAVSSSMAAQLNSHNASLAQVCTSADCHLTDNNGVVHAPPKDLGDGAIQAPQRRRRTSRRGHIDGAGGLQV